MELNITELDGLNTMNPYEGPKYEIFKQEEMNYWENNKTNETLRQLLMVLGYDIGTVFDPIKHKDLFFTNTVLCLKSGNMSSSITSKVYSN
jgi:hypothetical protein